MDDRAKSKGTEKPVTAEKPAVNDDHRSYKRKQMENFWILLLAYETNKQIHREIKATVHDMDRRNQ